MATSGQSTNPFATGYNDRFQQEQQRPPSKLEQTQVQVQEVVTIMKSNVDKVLERDSRLSELDTRADALSNSAQLFERRSTQIRKKMWWNNLKWKIILGVVLILAIVGIGFWIASSFKSSDNGGSTKSIENNNVQSNWVEKSTAT